MKSLADPQEIYLYSYPDKATVAALMQAKLVPLLFLMICFSVYGREYLRIVVDRYPHTSMVA